MNNGVVALSKHTRRRKAPVLRARPGPLPYYEWDVEMLAMLAIEQGAVPNLASCNYTIHLDPREPRYEITTMREGWDYPLVLLSAYRPGEPIEATLRREGGLWLLNQMLAAAFRVPAHPDAA